MPTILYILSAAGGTGDITFGLKLLLGLYLRYRTNEDEKPYHTFDLVLCQQAGGNPWISFRKLIEACDSLSLDFSILCRSVQLWSRHDSHTIHLTENSSNSNRFDGGNSHSSTISTDGENEQQHNNPSLSSPIGIVSYRFGHFDEPSDNLLYERYKGIFEYHHGNSSKSTKSFSPPSPPLHMHPHIILQGPLKLFDRSEDILRVLSELVSLPIPNPQYPTGIPPLLTIREMGQGRFCTPSLRSSGLQRSDIPPNPSFVSVMNPTNRNNYHDDVSSGFGSDEIGIFNETELYDQYYLSIIGSSPISSILIDSSPPNPLSTVWVRDTDTFPTYLESVAGTRFLERNNPKNTVLYPKYFVGYYRTPKHSIQYGRFIISYLLLSFLGKEGIPLTDNNDEIITLPIVIPLDIHTPSTVSSSSTYINYLLQGLRSCSAVETVEYIHNHPHNPSLQSIRVNSEDKGPVNPSLSSSSSSLHHRTHFSSVNLVLRIHQRTIRIHLPLYSTMELKFSLYAFYTLLSFSSGNIVTGDATLTETMSRASVSLYPVPYYYSVENHKVFIDQDIKQWIRTSISMESYYDGKNNEEIEQFKTSGSLVLEYWKYLDYRSKRKEDHTDKDDPSWIEFVNLLEKSSSVLLPMENSCTSSSSSSSPSTVPSGWDTLLEAFRITLSLLVQKKGNLIHYVGNWMDKAVP